MTKAPALARLLFICKRKPQGRCLLDRPYGRFFHLPASLAAIGHDVHVVLVSHGGEDARAAERGGVRWTSLDVRTTAFLSRLQRHAAGVRPDWVVGCSDAWAGWLAHRISRRVGARLAIDAYDDYEAYMPWNLPLHALWRRALRAADLTSAAGPQLAALMDSHRAGARATAVLPMAADPGFVPQPKQACREKLGLPRDLPIIGYSGGWAANRGTKSLPEAFQRLREQVPGAVLALTGKPPKRVTRQPGVLALGYLDDALLPVFLNAVDVAAVITTTSRFGMYSYPAKLCEAIACGIPVVATSTPPVAWMLGDHAEALVPPDSPGALCHGLGQALRAGVIRYAPRPGWSDIAAEWSVLFDAVDKTGGVGPD